MKFEKGKVYTHKSMLDTVIYVRHAFPSNENYVELKIGWFTRKGLGMNIQETIRIKVSEFPLWYQWDGQTEDWY